jgi:hypothetical protein
MRRIFTSLIGATAVFVAAVAVYVAATLPPRARGVSAAPDPRVVWGAYHVHSDRSDGGGSVDEIARAAADAGLHFVILTDHGDGTRAPDPPQYRHGVLVIDAVELNSTGGHVVALNLRDVAPFPLAGETRDVIEDVHRFGGLAIAAHPDSPRPGLRWRARGPQELDGIEWINLDSAWRANGVWTLAGVALRSLFRGPEAIATLIATPLPGLALADATNRTNRTVVVAALDAHARLGADADHGAGGGRGVSFPSYRTLFRTLAQAVRLRAPWSGTAADDSAALLAGLSQGRAFSVTRAFADGLPPVTFTARQGDRQVEMGGELPGGAPTEFVAEVGGGLTDVRLQLLRDGRPVAQGRGTLRAQVNGEAGAYRFEAHVGDQAVPWVVSNPIHLARQMPIAGPLGPGGGGAAEGAALEALAVTVRPDAWKIEADPATRSSLTVEGSEIRLSYQLAGGAPAGQYVALSTSASGELPLMRIELTLRSPRPMRVSVQVRTPGGTDGYRWRRSVFVDSTPRPLSIRLSELEPVERGSPLRPNVAKVQSVLLVIDTLNARPGSAGELVVVQARLVPGKAG